MKVFLAFDGRMALHRPLAGDATTSERDGQDGGIDDGDKDDDGTF
jgi:hypothetical protein